MSSSWASRRKTLTGALLYRRETICQLGARLRFDLLDQNPEHVVEQADVLVVVAAGPIEKERGNAPERLHALLA